MQDISVVKTDGRKKLESWLNKTLKIEMTDGRTLIGKCIIYIILNVFVFLMLVVYMSYTWMHYKDCWEYIFIFRNK